MPCFCMVVPILVMKNKLRSNFELTADGGENNAILRTSMQGESLEQDGIGEWMFNVMINFQRN